MTMTPYWNNPFYYSKGISYISFRQFHLRPMEQLIVFFTLTATLALFIWDKIRYDVVSLLALFVLVVLNIVPAEKAFLGFGHPAVITVAAVLVVSQALQNSGLVDVIARMLEKTGKNLTLQITILSGIVALASAFMNNIGALAILMPVAIHLARKSGNPPSYVLMPIAFASLLGGMLTLIGTPPNIIISTFRSRASGEPFSMFDFSLVGIFLVLAGLVFISLVGWRLLPKRKPQDPEVEDMFKIENYITEVRVEKDSKINGKAIWEIKGITKAEIVILGMVRQKERIHAPEPGTQLKTNDILMIEADTKEMKTFVDHGKVKLVGGKQFRKDAEGWQDITIQEAIIMENAPLIGETAVTLSMRTKYGINLLAVARRDKQIRQRIDHVRFKAGDVLLLQGRRININDAITTMHCLPLAKRGVSIGKPRRTVFALSVFVAAIALVVSGILPVQVAFSLAAIMMVMSNILPLKDVYNSVDWPVIVLLGAMIPVGEAFETTGAADLVTHHMLSIGQTFPVWATLAAIMVITIILSSVINNAATVVLMAPIGISIAQGLEASADPFLMAIAIGASSSFLTPIGHQSNTLVMGPGGYKFSDYWRMGLPLEIIVILISIPLILLFWPV